VTGAWFTEYFARVERLPRLGEFLDEHFGDGAPAAAEDQAEQDMVAATAWSKAIAAIGEAQEAAKAAGA